MFSNTCISVATLNDIPSLLLLLNSAYRGESSKKGWTSETHLIAGEVRTDEKNLSEIINQPGSVMLKYTDASGEIIGCVNLQQHDDKVYLGMLSVSPHLQGSGIGKQLLFAAEEFANHYQSSSIYMTVISLRAELIDWYIRHGYDDTGKRKDFKEDKLTGKHLQQLEFMVLEKKL